MSELWAQFDVNLSDVTFKLVNPTTVNDQASILQTIDGQTYLISLAQLGAGSPFGTGQPQPPPNGQGLTEFVSQIFSNGVAAWLPLLYHFHIRMT